MLFVDDHPIYRDGLQRALTSESNNLRVLVASGVQSAIGLLSTTEDIDLCLSDFKLTDGNGLSLLEHVRQHYPDIAIGILCADPTAVTINAVKAMGGVGCLSKDRDTEALAIAINAIFNGGVIFDDGSSTNSRGPVLSIRRREILFLAAQGQLDKQIGERMNISESTVRNHWLYIFSHLAANNRTEAVAKAVRLGLI